MTRTAQTLMAMYEAMLEHFGPQQWWPARGQLEICVGAILTQNTNWTNVEKAIANLNAAGVMDVAALHAMSAETLSELIRPAGYFRRKAGRLKNFIADVVDAGGDIQAYLAGDADALRNRLLAVNGVGPETADSIVLYAAGKLAFVVDAYTRRILDRHGLVAPDDDYEAIQSLLTGALPPEVQLYNEYHALLVCTGKHFCKPTARCAGCPLERFPHQTD